MVVWHLRAVVIISSSNYAKQLLPVIEPTVKDNFCGYKISSENKKKSSSLGPTSRHRITQTMCMIMNYLFLFFYLLCQKDSSFLCKTKICNGKINKSYDIMYGK